MFSRGRMRSSLGVGSYAGIRLLLFPFLVVLLFSMGSCPYLVRTGFRNAEMHGRFSPELCRVGASGVGVREREDGAFFSRSPGPDCVFTLSSQRECETSTLSLISSSIKISPNQREVAGRWWMRDT